MTLNGRKGFTLIELAIAIVIIGLLLTGILKGTEVLEQAKIESVIARFRSTDTAVVAFRNKYNGLPGDLRKAHTFQLDLDDAGNPNVSYTLQPNNDGNGDGSLNGTINGNGVGQSIHYQGEMQNFWVHMSNAKLIGSSISADPPGCSLVINIPCLAISDFSVMDAKIGDGIVAVTGSKELSDHIFYVLGIKIKQRNSTLTLTSAEGATSGMIGDTLTPFQAWSIDNKLDDGKPDKGLVQVVGAYTNDPVTGIQTLQPDTTLSATDCYSAVGGDYNYKVTQQVCTIAVHSLAQ